MKSKKCLILGVIMKRQKNNLIDCVTYNNLYCQYKVIRKNCKNKKKIFYFSKELNTNLYEIGKNLRNESYNFGFYNIFLIHENKYRIIMSENIDDKLVSHFLVNHALKKSLEPKMILQNVATREGLGGKAAYDFFEKHLRSIGYDKQIYALKIDVHKYFYSISHDVLKKMLKDSIKDDFTLDLINKIIDSTDNAYVNERIDCLIENEKNKVLKMNISLDEKTNLINELNKVPRYEMGRGLSIGCVVNQILSVFYLSPVDRYIKEELKCKYYVRYMDDLVVLSTDKVFLRNIFGNISNQIELLDLKVNSKSNIYNFNNGFTFLGKTYFIKNNKLYSKTKNKTYKKAIKRLNELRETDFSKYYLSKTSYLGIIKENLLYSLDEEYDFLCKKYGCFVLMEKNNCYVFDKKSCVYLEYKKNCVDEKKLGVRYLIKYLKKNKVECIFLSRTKVVFN